MSYESICLKGGHALLKEMSYGWSCVDGVHAFRMAYLTVCWVLLEDISYWMTCFT